MKEWIISVGATIIITSVASMIAPQGKMGPYIKGMFSFLLILVIVKPLISINLDQFNIESFLSETKIEYQSEYLDFITNKKIEKYQKKCELIIENVGVKQAEVDIDYIIGDSFTLVIKLIKVNLEKAVFISDKAHIDIIEEIKTSLSNYLNIEANKVVINE